MTGMLVAILLFAKVISYCLANFLYQTKAAVYGFMLGAVISLWPFREYLKVETANFRLQLLATNFIMPSEMSLENCLSLCLIICGWALVYYTKSWSQEENSLASS